MRRRIALFVLLVVLSGCLGVGGDDSSPPDADAAAQGYASLESVEGTVEIRTTGAENDSVTVHIVRRPKERMVRQEFISPSNQAGDVTVSNGSVTWIYNTSLNEVTRFNINETASNTSQGSFIREVFSNLSTSEESSVVAAPLRPIAPVEGSAESGSVATGFFGSSSQPADLRYLGTETIAEREAHGVRITPANASESTTTPANGAAAQHVDNVTYWFDAEYFHPLRTETTVEVDGEVTRSTRVYRNITFNVDPKSETFQFEPPANATVRSGPEPETFDSAAAAAERVNFPVADTDPPDRFEFDTAVVTRFDNRTTVSVQYSDRTDDLVVGSRRPPFEERAGERVSLGSVTGTRLTSGNTVVVTWQCGETGYAVSGQLPADTIEDVARDAVTVCSDRG